MLASAPGAGHISDPMASSPPRRAPKQGVRLDDGSVIAFSYMPRVADLVSSKSLPTHTRAHENGTWARRLLRDILAIMAGRPLRRTRAVAAQHANDESVTSRLARGGISSVAWRGLSSVDKLQALYGLSLEVALEESLIVAD
jgi:hypothetical protein